MKNNYISQLHFISKHLVTLLVLALLLFIGVGSVSGATITVSGNTNWSALTVGVGDIVYVRNGATLTVNVSTAVCASLQIGGTTSGGAGTLAFSGTNPKITVSGLVQVGGWGNTNRDGFITFTNTATIDAGSVILGGTGGTDAQGTINMTAGGTLKTGSLTVGSGSGTWTPGTGTVILDATNTLPATIFTNFNNLSTDGTGTTTTAANLTIGGNLIIGDGTTFNTTSAYNLSVGGATNIGNGTSGILNFGGWGGTKIFTGLVNVNSGGTWNNSGNLAVNFRGGITNNGTFTVGAGTQTFENTAQSLMGNLDISGAATVFNTNVTNQGTLTLTANVSGSGALINTSTGTLNLASYTTITTLTNQGIMNLTGGNTISTPFANFTNTGTLNLNGTNYILGITNNAAGTVNYINASQTIGTFNNATATSILNISALISSASAINTLTATASGNTINYSGAGDQTVKNVTYSNLLLSGSGTKTFTGATTINNTFTNNNVVANLSNFTHTTTVYFLVGTQQSIGSWGGSGSTATNKNNINFSPIVTGILNVTAGCASGYWTGATSTDWNVASNWCDGIIPTAATNVVIPNVARQPIIGKLGGLCNNITINSSAFLTQKNDSASNLFVYGNWTNNGSYTSGVGTTTFAGTSAQTIGGSTNTSFYNLTIQNTGGVTLNRPTTVTRTILLITGNVNTTANLLTVTNNVNSGIMGGSSLSFINGPVNWYLPSSLAAGSQYKFPVGNNTYLPYTLIPTTNTSTGISATVQAFNGNPNPANTAVNSPLTAISKTEYWKLTQTTGFNNISVTLGKGDVEIYPYNVIAEGANISGNFNSIGGTAGFYDIINSNTTSNINSYFTLGTTNTPIINVAPPQLGGFAYTINFGPSAEQTFTVNGTSLSTGITINAPTDFEISLTSGTGFQSTITLPAVSNKVASTIIYLRLKAGLAIGTYPPENITLTSTGATTVQITCNGTVFGSTPSITTSGGRLCPPNNNQVQLSSTANNINILYWSGPNNFYAQKDTLINPADATYNGKYTVTGTLPTGANLLINGDFEAGNVGFLSSYSYINVVADGTNNTAEGIYAVIANPHWLHNGFDQYSLNHTPSPGKLQMVINGATTANVTVWSETVKVVPNSTYQFTYWLQSVVNGNPSIVQLYANNQPVGTPFTAIQATNNYKKYYYNWYSGSSTSVTLDLRNMNTVAGGNDFAIDDLDFRTVTYVSSSLNVSASTAAAVSITTPTTNVAAGSNVTFTATPTNGGTAPLYQWKVNGSNVGTNSSSSTFNYVPNTGDVITCVMTSNNSCTTPNTATSNAIIMTVTGTSNYWMGTYGTVWNDPANWTANKVPGTGDNVEFATEANNGGVGKAAKNDLYLDYNRVVGNLINNASGRNLIIDADKELMVNNKIILTPVDVTKKYDQIQIKADNTGVLPNGSLIFYNPRTEPVNATIELYSKAYKENTPIVVPTGSYSYNWQLFGIPLTSVAADPTFYDSYVRQYQEDKSGLYTKWNQLSNSSVLKPFKGYEITQLAPKTLIFQGTLVNNDTTISLPVTAKNTVPTVYFRGQHILSNPYAAAIDAREIVYGANTESTAYLYNTGSFAKWYNNGGSTTYDETSATAGQYIALPKVPSGSNGVPYDIPSMSGFLVKATDTLVVSPATPSPGSVQINYSSVIIKNAHPLRVKKTESISSTDLISTRIDLIGLHYSDRMWIFTEPSCTKNFDNGWDGRKILGSSLAPQIYAVEPDGDYQVNSVADMHNTDIAFQPGDEVEYTMKFTNENIKQKYAGVYLQDLVENKTVDVTESGTIYKFATTPASEPSKRFKIITRYYEKDAPDNESTIKIFSARGTVYIHNLSTYSGECSLYDVLGRTIVKKTYGPNSVIVIDNLTQGAYVTTASTNGEKVSKRVIVQ